MGRLFMRRSTGPIDSPTSRDAIFDWQREWSISYPRPVGDTILVKCLKAKRPVNNKMPFVSLRWPARKKGISAGSD